MKVTVIRPPVSEPEVMITLTMDEVGILKSICNAASVEGEYVDEALARHATAWWFVLDRDKSLK